MTHDDNEQRALMQRAMDAAREILQDHPCMVVAGFDMPGGIKICSISNVSTENQIDMMNMLIEGFNPAPQGTTLN